MAMYLICMEKFQVVFGIEIQKVEIIQVNDITEIKKKLEWYIVHGWRFRNLYKAVDLSDEEWKTVFAEINAAFKEFKAI